MLLKKGLLFTITLALLAFAGQASAGPNANATVSLDLISDGGAGNQIDNRVTSGTVSGQDTKIAVEVFAKGVTTPLAGVVIIFEFDASVLKLDKVENSAFPFAIPEPTGVNFATTTPVTLPSSGFIGHAEFSTVADITGKEFTLGIKAVTLAQSSASSDVITTTNVISFNEPTSGEFAGMQLHLDTQIETPAAYNNTLTIPEQKAGDTIGRRQTDLWLRNRTRSARQDIFQLHWQHIGQGFYRCSPVSDIGSSYPVSTTALYSYCTRQWLSRSD
ncbi:MAG: hypothetical protein F4Y79_02390 [Gemmatimonadetes bacterium]|nr:hypothetical protein [Gemmatimonadota bacterium]